MEKFNILAGNLKSKECLIKINEFEGPLDLLCYLVKSKKMEIDDISISEITDEYLDYIYSMEKLNLEIASEFVVMSSILIYLKSQKLLPNYKQQALEEEIDGEITEEKLKEKIKTYQKYKEIAGKFADMYEKCKFRTFKKEEDIIYDKLEFNGRYLPHSLARAYKMQKLKYEGKDNLNKENIDRLVLKEKVSVRSKLKEIMDIFKNVKSFVFGKVFNEKRSKPEVVAAFLGVLEMSNKSKVKTIQEEQFGDIEVIKIIEKKK